MQGPRQGDRISDKHQVQRTQLLPDWWVNAPDSPKRASWSTPKMCIAPERAGYVCLGSQYLGLADAAIGR